jgi:hypothetical protein
MQNSTPPVWQRLPAEIKHQILGNLSTHRENLVDYAAVCKDWKDFFLPLATSVLANQHTIANLEHLDARSVNAIRSIEFHVLLRRYDCQDCQGSDDDEKGDSKPRDTSIESQNYDSIMETSLTAFHNQLLQWARRNLLNFRGVKIDLSLYSPSDHEHHFPYLTVSDPSERRVLSKIYVDDDKRHGWHRYHDVRTREQYVKAANPIFHGPLFGTRIFGSYLQFRAVNGVTELCLRRQTRLNIIGRGILAPFFVTYPSIDTVHVELWRVRDRILQGLQDHCKSYLPSMPWSSPLSLGLGHPRVRSCSPDEAMLTSCTRISSRCST